MARFLGCKMTPKVWTQVWTQVWTRCGHPFKLFLFNTPFWGLCPHLVHTCVHTFLSKVWTGFSEGKLLLSILSTPFYIIYYIYNKIGVIYKQYMYNIPPYIIYRNFRCGQVWTAKILVGFLCQKLIKNV